MATGPDGGYSGAYFVVGEKISEGEGRSCRSVTKTLPGCGGHSALE